MRRTVRLLAVLAMAAGAVFATGSPAAASSLDCYFDQVFATGLRADVCLERHGGYLNGQQIKLQGHVWVENRSSAAAFVVVNLSAGSIDATCLLSVPPHSTRYCGTNVAYDFDPALDRARAGLTWTRSGVSGTDVLYSPYG